MMTPRWLAHVLGISPKTLRHWLRQDDLTHGRNHAHRSRWYIDPETGRRMYLRRQTMRKTGAA
jgi:predicted site-specific integrase-resolvase